jgi:hypothetical protein
MTNLSFLITPKILASSFGNFFVKSFNGVCVIGHDSVTKLSSNLILFCAKLTLSKAPGASNFL